MDFKAAGFGGFYLHSRPGLLTDYLSEDWWDLMEVAVEAANEVGLRCMFYDEDKWPSGYAGGRIPELSEDYRAKGLAKLDLQTTPPPGSIVLKKDDRFQYIQYTAQYGYDIFNGTCYIDLYNPEVVRAFIESTHLPYFEKYADKIKENELVIFTDEPHIHARYFDRATPHHGTLSYSPFVNKKFEELYGSSLNEQVDLLFEEKGNWRAVRWQYHRAKALQFEASFTKQIADFCEEHGAQLTGHYLGEDGLQKVRDRIGNSSLHYRSMQQPGIDHLGLSTAHRLLTPKYLSSVANQYGQRMRMSELFGISGHNINFQERRWLAGWHAVLGVNHFVPHLTSYSIKGARKRDYPPTFSYHQPYWAYNKQIEDYLGRISYAATLGQYDPQVLIISPLESEYLKSREEGEFTGTTLRIAETLQNHQIDFDLGDEEIISEVGGVTGTHFFVGAMQYRYVILPDMLTMRKSTLALLLKFARNGGTILSLGELPSWFDAQEDPQAVTLLRSIVTPLASASFDNDPHQHIKTEIHIKGEQARRVWVQSRRLGTAPFYLLYNTSNVAETKVNVQLPTGTEQALLWDPAQMKIHKLVPDNDGSIFLELAAGGTYWITTGTLSEDVPTETTYALPGERNAILNIPSPWLGKREDPNALTLDFATYSTDGGTTFSEPEPVIGIWSRLRDEKYHGELRLRFSADVQHLPRQCALAMEQSHAFRQILVNGNAVPFSESSYFIGQSIKSTTITELLRTGQNVIELQIDFEPPNPLSSDPRKRYETELESIYLTGDFGVFSKKNQTIENTQRNRSEDLPNRPVYAMDQYFIDKEQNRFSGNMVLEGYPFYAGSFTLSNSFELPAVEPDRHYFIDLAECEAIVTEVYVNEQLAGTLSWAPYTVDITPYLKEGQNAIRLRMRNSLRNLLGPHHHQGGELIKVGPNSFTGAGGFPDGRGESNWYDLRKGKAELAIWTDRYYHIPFGMVGNVRILVE